MCTGPGLQRPRAADAPPRRRLLHHRVRLQRAGGAGTAPAADGGAVRQHLRSLQGGSTWETGPSEEEPERLKQQELLLQNQTSNLHAGPGAASAVAASLTLTDLPLLTVERVQHHGEGRPGEPREGGRHHGRDEADPHAHGQEVRADQREAPPPETQFTNKDQIKIS